MANFELIAAINAANKGRFMTVTFETLDGRIRKINGRFGVKKFTTSPDSRNPDAFWGTREAKVFGGDKGYRQFINSRVVSVRCMGAEVLASTFGANHALS